jgi:hypothetical protein
MEAADITKIAPHQKPANSYAEAAISGSLHTAPPANTSADQGFTLDIASAVPSPKVSAVQVDFDELQTVTYKKKTTICDPAVNTVKHHPQPLIVVHNSPFLPVISK